MTDNQYKRKLKKHFKIQGYSKDFIKQALPEALKIRQDMHDYHTSSKEKQELIDDIINDLKKHEGSLT